MEAPFALMTQRGSKASSPRWRILPAKDVNPGIGAVASSPKGA